MQTFAEFVDSVTNFIGGAVANLLLTLAVVVFFWAVINFIIKRSQGATDGIKQGREMLGWSIIGLFVMFSIWGIINFLQGSFGIDKDNSINSPSTKLNLNRFQGGTNNSSGNNSNTRNSNTQPTPSSNIPLDYDPSNFDSGANDSYGDYLQNSQSSTAVNNAESSNSSIQQECNKRCSSGKGVCDGTLHLYCIEAEAGEKCASGSCGVNQGVCVNRDDGKPVASGRYGICIRSESSVDVTTNFVYDNSRCKGSGKAVKDNNSPVGYYCVAGNNTDYCSFNSCASNFTCFNDALAGRPIVKEGEYGTCGTR